MDYLDRNISALERLYPEFSERLCDAVGDKHLLRTDDEQVHYIHCQANEVDLGMSNKCVSRHFVWNNIPSCCPVVTVLDIIIS